MENLLGGGLPCDVTARHFLPQTSGTAVGKIHFSEQNSTRKFGLKIWLILDVPVVFGIGSVKTVMRIIYVT